MSPKCSRTGILACPHLRFKPRAELPEPGQCLAIGRHLARPSYELLVQAVGVGNLILPWFQNQRRKSQGAEKLALSNDTCDTRAMRSIICGKQLCNFIFKSWYISRPVKLCQALDGSFIGKGMGFRAVSTHLTNLQVLEWPIFPQFVSLHLKRLRKLQVSGMAGHWNHDICPGYEGIDVVIPQKRSQRRHS